MARQVGGQREPRFELRVIGSYEGDDRTPVVESVQLEGLAGSPVGPIRQILLEALDRVPSGDSAAD